MSSVQNEHPPSPFPRPLAAHAAAGEKSYGWLSFFTVLGFALLVRLVLFNGPFGSDDVVYYVRSAEIADGIWSSANYNGALRYGFNIPAGILMYFFGKSYFAANLWPLFCSLAEVAIVYRFAKKYWNERAALFSGLLIASVPLHIGVSTRLHTDPVVSAMLTAAFVLLYAAHRSGRNSLYLWSGLALGAVFWTKELAAITFIAFLAFPLLWRRLDKGWFVLAGGALAMLLLHFLLMQYLSGDPFHLFRVVLSMVNSVFIEGSTGEDGPFYYFKYLFLDLRHTGLLGFFSLLSIIFIRFGSRQQGATGNGSIAFVLTWALALIAVLSWLPVSLSPFRFAWKQSNYLTLFLAPLCLLAGLFLARIPNLAGNLLLGASLSIGIFFAALAQADYRVFVSNSKAAVEFALQHPQARIAGSTSNSGMAAYLPVSRNGNTATSPIAAFWELVPGGARQPDFSAHRDWPIYAIFDRQTLEWAPHGTVLGSAPPCWSKLADLSPAGLGVGNALAKAAAQGLDPGASSIVRAVRERFLRLSAPAPATVYGVEGDDIWCGKAPR